MAFTQLFYTSPNSDSTLKEESTSRDGAWIGRRARELFFLSHLGFLPPTEAQGYGDLALPIIPPKGRPGLFLGKARKVNSTWGLLGTHQSRLSSLSCGGPGPLPFQGRI